MNQDTKKIKWVDLVQYLNFISPKAELLQEGIFFPHPFICLRRLSNENIGNQKIKPTFSISVLKVEY